MSKITVQYRGRGARPFGHYGRKSQGDVFEIEATDASRWPMLHETTQAEVDAASNEAIELANTSAAVDAAKAELAEIQAQIAEASAQVSEADPEAEESESESPIDPATDTEPEAEESE